MTVRSPSPPSRGDEGAVYDDDKAELGEEGSVTYEDDKATAIQGEEIKGHLGFDAPMTVGEMRTDGDVVPAGVNESSSLDVSTGARRRKEKKREKEKGTNVALLLEREKESEIVTNDFEAYEQQEPSQQGRTKSEQADFEGDSGSSSSSSQQSEKQMRAMLNGSNRRLESTVPPSAVPPPAAILNIAGRR